ncbi:hypothetical protein ABMA27_014423 [Loxostege sticticalis]|uniref:Guanine nucleotide-binding protein subunit gamma n=1 Tax=Loxostege sticticalis TaxID=481309 RepID=A0ABR3I8W7_LOXSC
MDPSILAAMDKEALKKQIENMKYQASMERWPLSKSIALVTNPHARVDYTPKLSAKDKCQNHRVTLKIW